MHLEGERLFVTWSRSGIDGQDHAITDEAYAPAHMQRGYAEAVCGHLATPVSLTVPPGPRCRACQLYVRARATLPDFDLRRNGPIRRHRPTNLLRRLLPKPPGRSVADEAVPRAGRPGSRHGGPVETPTSEGTAVRHYSPKE